MRRFDSHPNALPRRDVIHNEKALRQDSRATGPFRLDFRRAWELGLIASERYFLMQTINFGLSLDAVSAEAVFQPPARVR
jgi:hypothetical protein